MLHSWKFGKIMYICYTPWKFQDQKFKTLGNFLLIFLVLSYEFHFVFNWTLEILHAISWILLEVLYSDPPPLLFFFSGIVKSWRPCVSSNTFLYSIMKRTYHKLLVYFFHKLISMQDVGHNMLHLHVDQQLLSL